MKIIFPWQPLAKMRWVYYWERPLEAIGAVVKVDPYALTSDARHRIAGDISAANTPFKDRPSWGEQQRRRNTPVGVIYGIFKAERFDHLETKRKLQQTTDRLIDAQRELTALKRRAGGLAGARDGLQIHLEGFDSLPSLHKQMGKEIEA